MKNSPLAQYPADMVAAVQIALVSGHYYNNDLVPFVFKAIEAGRREVVLSSIVELDVSTVGFLDTVNETVARLSVDVPKLPRGHYVVVRIHQGHNKFHYRTFISLSFGNRFESSNGGAYDQMPHDDEILLKAGIFEIIKCRQAVDKYNKITKNVAAIKKHNLDVGYIHQGTFNIYGRTSNEVTIIAISSECQLQISIPKTFGAGPCFTSKLWVSADEFVTAARLMQKAPQMKIQTDLFEFETA
jgi:hypothetical protein